MDNTPAARASASFTYINRGDDEKANYKKFIIIGGANRDE